MKKLIITESEKNNILKLYNSKNNLFEQDEPLSTPIPTPKPKSGEWEKIVNFMVDENGGVKNDVGYDSLSDGVVVYMKKNLKERRPYSYWLYLDRRDNLVKTLKDESDSGKLDDIYIQGMKNGRHVGKSQYNNFERFKSEWEFSHSWKKQSPFRLTGGTETPRPFTEPEDPKGMLGPALEVYKVKPGDNLTKIAKLMKTTVNQIMKDNPSIKDPNMIKPGQTIDILRN